MLEPRYHSGSVIGGICHRETIEVVAVVGDNATVDMWTIPPEPRERDNQFHPLAYQGRVGPSGPWGKAGVRLLSRLRWR